MTLSSEPSVETISAWTKSEPHGIGTLVLVFDGKGKILNVASDNLPQLSHALIDEIIRAMRKTWWGIKTGETFKKTENDNA